MQRQYGTGIDAAGAQISYDMYLKLVERIMESPWQRVGADVTGGGVYARSISIRSN